MAVIQTCELSAQIFSKITGSAIGACRQKKYDSNTRCYYVTLFGELNTDALYVLRCKDTAPNSLPQILFYFFAFIGHHNISE